MISSDDAKIKLQVFQIMLPWRYKVHTGPAMNNLIYWNWEVLCIQTTQFTIQGANHFQGQSASFALLENTCCVII